MIPAPSKSANIKIMIPTVSCTDRMVIFFKSLRPKNEPVNAAPQATRTIIIEFLLSTD